jgi:hypothetical protein
VGRGAPLGGGDGKTHIPGHSLLLRGGPVQARIGRVPLFLINKKKINILREPGNGWRLLINLGLDSKNNRMADPILRSPPH